MTKFARGAASPSGVIIINVEIHEDEGLYVATSRQFPEINVAHPSMAAIFEDLPNIIGAICQDRYGVKMTVLPADVPDSEFDGWRWVAIPAPVAARACA